MRLTYDDANGDDDVNENYDANDDEDTEKSPCIAIDGE